MTQETDFYAQILESQRRAAEQRVETRAALLSELCALGVRSIEVQYEGYGDSGNVEDVVVTPDTINLTEELRRRLAAHPCHACEYREEHARWAWTRMRWSSRTTPRTQSSQ